jgi:hypothetical protein
VCPCSVSQVARQAAYSGRGSIGGTLAVLDTRRARRYGR